MRNLGAGQILRVASSAAALLAAAASHATAQCPMCGQAVAYAGSKPGSAYPTFQAAAIVLLVPVVLFLGSVGVLLRRFRH